MKSFLLISLIIITSCSKETTKNSARNSSLPENEKISGKTKSITENGSENKNDSTDTANTGLGYIQYGIAKVPDEIKYEGSVVAMAQWKDKNGSNVLFITETNEKSNEDTRSKELFGYNYISDNEGNTLLWKINDFIKDCPVDLTLDYIDKSMIITDLNENGIGESSFLYKMSCKGDVSSDAMKLIMHESEDKFAIRGEMNLEMNGQELQKGSMNIDPSFESAPDGFREFAVSRWKKFNTENIGN